MSLSGIHASDYGYALEATVKDVDSGAAQDISTYTTRQYLLTDPHGNVSTVTASFKTDGSDGILTYTVQSGDIDEPGRWLLQVRLVAASTAMTSAAQRFNVLSRLDG